MTTHELTALAPYIVVAVTAVLALLTIGFTRQHMLVASLTGLGLLFAGLTLLLETVSVPRQVTPLLRLDGLSCLFMGLILAATLALVLLSFGYLERQRAQREEFYVLLLLATLGAMVLVASSHFASFFLGLELLSISLVGMIAYTRARPLSLAAGVKYLVLAAVSVAFTLFGMALIYASQGTLALADLDMARLGTTALGLAGLVLLLVGVGYKLALVPFHMWAADVYAGAPLPTTTYVATVSKIAMFAFLLRFLGPHALPAVPAVQWLLSAVAIVSMLGGNWLALRESNVRRLLAFSSIAHLGYLLVALLASSTLALTAAAFYLVAYTVTTLGAFGVVGALSGPAGEVADRRDFRALFWRRPWPAAVMSAALFSLAGIPLTAGFVGKFFVLTAGVDTLSWLLPLALVVSSAIGLYYYLNLIVTMLREPQPAPAGQPGSTPAAPAPAMMGSLVLALLLLLLLWLGVYPAPLLRLISTAVTHVS